MISFSNFGPSDSDPLAEMNRHLKNIMERHNDTPDPGDGRDTRIARLATCFAVR